MIILEYCISPQPENWQALMKMAILLRTKCLVSCLLLTSLPLNHSIALVDTDPQAVLEKGSKGVLPCRVDRDVNAVTWSRGTSETTAEIVVISRIFNNEWIKEGPGYSTDIYDMDDDYSLIINDVRVGDDGDFFCEILDKDTGTNFVNKTSVIVYATPTEPFPIIHECQQSTDTQTDEQMCSLPLQALNITCTVTEYFPNISVYFLHDSLKISNIQSTEWDNADGTKNKSVTMFALASIEPYICVVSDIPGLGRIEYNSSIYLTAIEDETTFPAADATTVWTTTTYMNDESSNTTIKIVVPVVVVILVATVILIIMLWICQRRHQRPSRGEKEIEKRIPEEICLIDEINIPDSAQTLDEIPAIKSALKRLYVDIFREIRTSPLDERNKLKIDEIFINLSLLVDQSSDAYKVMSYQQLIDELNTSRRRIAFLGEAGVGKTTLLIKIAYDWALGRCLPNIELLLFIPLRELSKVTSFSDILKVYATRRTDINGQRVEQYVRDNKRKAMLLLDGLDEYDADISNEHQSDVLLNIITEVDLEDTPVVVTTRPWRAEQVISMYNEHYLRVKVRGFSKEDVKRYITKFFRNDSGSAKSLIQLLTEDSLVTKNMAPYPIFCCMLCNMWKQPARRETIKTLHTFSQLFEEMISSLIEHWLSKKSFRDYRNRCDKSLREIGTVAFKGLLANKLVFSNKTFEGCMEAKKTACEIGVLSIEKKFGEEDNEDQGGRTFYSFPHKLFQEYLAGLYLSSMYIEDQDEFKKLVQNKVLTDYQKLRYLLYFTMAHGKNPGHGSKALMDSICKRVADLEFVLDIAFECYDKTVIAPAIEYIKRETQLRLCEDLQLVKNHTWSGYVYLLVLCGEELMETDPVLKAGPIGNKESDKSSYAAAIGLFTLPLLLSLELDGVRLDDAFFVAMAIAAPQAQISKLRLQSMHMSPVALKQAAKGLFNMPRLHSLEIQNVNLESRFFTVMVDLASKTQVRELTLNEITLDADSVQQCPRAVFTMSKLQSLHLKHMKLDQRFFLVMAHLAEKSQIGELSFEKIKLDSTVAKLFVRGLSGLNNLHTLGLHRVQLDQKIVNALPDLAPTSKIETLLIGGLSVTRPMLSSFLSFPLLRSLHVTSISCPHIRGQEGTTESAIPNSILVEIVTDVKSLTILRELKLSELCPKIRHLRLDFRAAFSSDIISTACLTFPRISQLGLTGTREYWIPLDDASSFCQKVRAFYPQLTALSFTDLDLGNKMAADITRSGKDLDNMKELTFTRCKTDAEIDTIITEMNLEEYLAVTIQHD